MAPFISQSSWQLQASRDNYQLAFNIVVQVESQIQKAKFGNLSRVLLAQLFISGMRHGQKISGYSTMVVLIEQKNTEAHCIGFSVLPLAGQYTNYA